MRAFRRVTLRRKRGPLEMTVKYFIPDWDDYVDPAFDFETDSWSGGSPAEREDVYAHQLYDRAPYDGVLVSLAQITKKKGILKNGVAQLPESRDLRDLMHLPEGMLLMGDCGAFSYIGLDAPPFDPLAAAGLYEGLGFDCAASVDHIVFPSMQLPDRQGRLRRLSAPELDRRVKVTRQNARKFIDEVRTQEYQFEPVGVIQARTAKQYAAQVKVYADMGYRHVAVGGVVPRRTEHIRHILTLVGAAVSRLGGYGQIKVHLFGTLREDLLPELAQFGVTSFDSASYLRKAWLRSGKNYLGDNDTWYAAVRVPFSSDPRIKAQGRSVRLSPEEVATLEARCLELLGAYGDHEVGIEETLDAVMTYDRLLIRVTSDGHNLDTKYRRTLQDRPWEGCGCAVCAALGIHVVVFRGINRNRRRGFHNTWKFYNRMRGTS